MRCLCSGRGATTQHRAPAGPTATPRPTEENQHLLKRQKGREAEACVGAGPRSILLAESHARLAQGRRAHACTRSPRTAVAVRVRTRAPSRPVRPQPRGSGRTRHPGRTRSPRALAASGRSLGEGRRVGAQGGGAEPATQGAPGRSPGVHLRGPGAGRRRGPGAPAAAASCAGTKTRPSRGSRTEEAAGGAATRRAGIL